MNIDKRLMLLLAVTASAMVGAAFASRTRRRHVHAVGKLQHKAELKIWENEGGNLAPIPGSTVQPAVQPAAQS